MNPASISQSTPPCIVLGLETQIGLGIVRELGRAGVRVIGIAQEAHAIGLASSYLARALVVTEPRSAKLITMIHALGEELGDCCLIAVSETNLVWLAANRTRLGRVRPITPSAAAMEIVLDKQRTLRVARALGIRTPESTEPTSLDDVLHLAASVRFPVVLKWSDPVKVAHSLDAAALDVIKAEYIYSAAELVAVGRRYAPIGKWPLVQTYCPGYGLGQFFYMHQGECLRRFQHRRIAEWPPEGGFSSVCDAVSLGEHVALQAQSIALLQAIGWEGVAMVEYRFDPVNGKAVLMEINGRYWGSYPLAVACDAGFAVIAYCLHSHVPLPTLPPVRQDVRCRMVATELKRLVRICLQPQRIVDRAFKIRKGTELTRFIADFFSPRVCYYVWSVADPRPFLADIANVVRKAIHRDEAAPPVQKSR